MFGWLKRPASQPTPQPELNLETLFANRSKTHYSRPTDLIVDFAADTRHDLAYLPVQLYAAYGRGPSRREVAMHLTGSEITVDTLEASFNKFITALREIENGNRDD